MSTPLADQLERARRELLDLTARNRLLNTPLGRGRSTRLDLVDELSSEVFRILVQERKEMSFLPAADVDIAEAHDDVEDRDEDEESLLSQPTESEPGDGTSDRNKDRNLQTVLVDDKLQTRLLRLSYDAKAMFEEQGVNSLFLAMGFLEWYDSKSSDKVRYAPLLLIPIEVDRKTVNARFRVRALEDEVTTNLSLQAKLKVDYGLQLPDLPQLDELVPEDYFSEVERVIADQPRWLIHRDRMTMWFFSFAKFLMFRDLDPEVWPEGKGPADHPLVSGLLGEPVAFAAPLIGESDSLDERIDPQTQCHVLDVDSSQAAAIEEVRSGRNLVIQGPPGTGKSQSIVSVIASAVRDGKTVLFVAEKLAALRVVKSRLDGLGLGDICLELHSHKANRRVVLDDLNQALDLRRPADPNVEQKIIQLVRSRDRLNNYVRQLHQPIAPSGRTPYELIGTLLRLESQEVKPFSGALPTIAAWSAVDIQEKKSLLNDIAEHLTSIGSPNTHGWRGVMRQTPLLPSDLHQLRQHLDDTCTKLREILHHAEQLASLMRLPWNSEEESLQSVQRLAKFAGKLHQLPPMDRAAYSNNVWEQHPRQVSQVIERGLELKSHQDSLVGTVRHAAWKTDVSQLRTDLAMTGSSFLRWFQPRWWRAIATLRGISEQPVPRELPVQLSILDQLIDGQACITDLSENRELDKIGRAAFGTEWRGLDSDWNSLRKILDWDAVCRKADVPKQFRMVIQDWEDPQATHAANLAVRKIFRETWAALQEAVKQLEVDLAYAFGHGSLDEVPLSLLLSKLETWHTTTAELGRWIVFQRRLRELEQAGLEALLPDVERGEIDEYSAYRLELMYCEAAMGRVLREREEIAGFDGVSQSRMVDEFRRLDKERIQLARSEVAAAHHARLPKGGDYGEIGIIRGEIRKKRRHKTLRRLLADAGCAVQAIKPVFMMSPISVAQFLEPGKLQFDLLVIDEASQVRPVEALGAVMRCNQAAVVGDHRQLPPTAFFDRVASSDEETDDQDDTEATDVESILDLCLARNYPQRMLRWHYRSRHHSLIAISNREFYDNQLFIVPSPEREGSGRGLEFQFIPNGVFDRGRSRTNRREARVVAETMIQHAQYHPEMSLGVGTFSVTQRDAILDELELLRRAHPETEEFFCATGEEPWFVKNLENIQGDERDVIFISVGYGRDESGYFGMNFGPLTAKGGERRLNVLISRAKQRCLVFSSIHADDIDLRRTSSRGTEAFKAFLQYAETGRIELNRPTNRDCDSEFETQVADAIRSYGFEIDYQVGIAGFFIDLAVIDPEVPGRYLLGIECDGATYHSSRWARDRDRLRQAVLEDHGWTLHRIWSTDWFHSRDEQLRKLLETIEDLRCRTQSEETSSASISGKRQWAQEWSAYVQNNIPANADGIVREEEETPDDTPATTLYEESQFTDGLMSREIHELSPTELARIVTRIVQIEGPVHGDEITRRVTSLWGLQRAGSRIGKSVERALKFAERDRKIAESSSFYVSIGQQEFPVRSRENVSSSSLRKPEMLPPQEIDAAIMTFITAHISATAEETARAVARQFGFRSTSQQLKSRIEERIEALVNTQGLIKTDDLLRIA